MQPHTTQALSRRTIWKIRILVIAVFAAIVLTISRLADVNFWTILAIVVVGLFLNGCFAEWEDRQPGGGFYDPTPDGIRNTEKPERK